LWQAHKTVAAPQKSPDLTFYSELADKPTESGGSVIRVKKTPEVKKRKARLKTADSKNMAVANSTLWELGICSLPHEIKARLERSKLIKDFPGVKIEPVQVAGKGTWYRVKISDIENRELAERYRQELSQKYHYKPIVRLQ
jgi:cell division protein FtsN